MNTNIQETVMVLLGELGVLESQSMTKRITQGKLLASKSIGDDKDYHYVRGYQEGLAKALEISELPLRRIVGWCEVFLATAEGRHIGLQESAESGAPNDEWAEGQIWESDNMIRKLKGFIGTPENGKGKGVYDE